LDYKNLLHGSRRIQERIELGHHTGAGNKVINLEITVHSLLEFLNQLWVVGRIALNIPKDLFVLAGNPGASKVIQCSGELSLTIRCQYCLSGIEKSHTVPPPCMKRIS
jgi:hypothetical protein